MSLQQLESNAVKIKRKVKRCITWLSKVSCLGENRKQPTFYDATSCSPAKWCLRNERRNSILIMHHYPDLVSASDCLKTISYAARSVESIACIADVKVVAGDGGECKKEEKSTPDTKAASFALRPSFQLSQLSLQRPIRIRRTLFLHEWPHVGMYRQKRFRSSKTWENLCNGMSAPRLPQKFVKGDGNPMQTLKKKIADVDFVELTLLLGEDESHLKIYFRRREVQGWF